MKPHVFSKCVPVMAAGSLEALRCLDPECLQERVRVVNILSQHIWRPAQGRKDISNSSQCIFSNGTTLSLGKLGSPKMYFGLDRVFC